MNQNKGFTTVEILVSLAIAVILLIAATSNLFGYFSRQALEDEAKTMLGMLRNAQEKSMGQENGDRWGVTFRNASDARDYYAFFEVDEVLLASTTYTGIPGTTIEQRALRSTISFNDPSEGDYVNVVFDKVTGIPTASTTVAIENTAGITRTIHINGSGLLDYE